jgi:predicted nucleic-acid-binding protein
MRAVDTNVLVRLLVVDDVDQARSAESFVAGGAWVSHLVLAETTWVLGSVYRHSNAEIMAAIRALLDQDVLAIQEPDVVAAALAQLQTRPNNSFSDCLVLEIARKAGHTPLGTFDKDLAKLPGVERLRG